MVAGMTRAAWIGWLALAWIGVAPAARADDAPRRVGSFNLCADQLLVSLDVPVQIAGLSPLAADPHSSVVAQRAAAFPRLDWQAESTIALSPDLVLVGPWDRSATRRLLASFGQRVEVVDLVDTVDAARKKILQFAALVGHPERGEAMAAALDAARARVAKATTVAGSTVLAVERGGYAAGPDSLVAALLGEAGLRPPPGAPPGLGGFVSLEALLVMRPDLLVLKDAPASASDQGSLFLTHPALRAMYPPNRRIDIPTRYALCGGPALIEALDYLAGVLPTLSPVKP